MRLYSVYAQVVTETSNGYTSTGTPTFYLDIDALGIVSDDHAERIARKVVDPLGVAKEVHAHVAKV